MAAYVGYLVPKTLWNRGVITFTVYETLAVVRCYIAAHHMRGSIASRCLFQTALTCLMQEELRFYLVKNSDTCSNLDALLFGS
jgi:hypothetical protein